MPRLPRAMVVDPVDVGVYHCISRCVRRAFLCGVDAVSGKSFEYRRQWIQDRMRWLAGIFGIDVLAFAVMSNHLHIVLRNRPDVIAGWSDDEVAQRWWRLFPLRREADGSPAEPEDHELQMLVARVESLRSRLADVSWFMRCLSEGIARRANREDDCTGRFWEGRYKCQPLLDEAAIVACMAYVDLNPIRAGIAVTPEASTFTSAHERIQAEAPTPLPQPSVTQTTPVQTPAAQATSAQSTTTTPTATPATPKTQATAAATARSAAQPMRRDDWLAPLELASTHAEESAKPVPLGRASNRGCLPLSLAEYLQLLDWTGRQIHRDKRGSIPSDRAPIVQRLGIHPDQWLHLVSHYGKLFRGAAGRPSSLQEEATRREKRWLQGSASARQVFA